MKAGTMKQIAYKSGDVLPMTQEQIRGIAYAAGYPNRASYRRAMRDKKRTKNTATSQIPQFDLFGARTSGSPIYTSRRKKLKGYEKQH